MFQNAFQQGIDELAGLLEEEPVDMRKIYAVVHRTATLGFETKEIAIFVRESAQPRYAPQYGGGTLFQKIQRGCSGRETDRDVFGLCLQRLEDVLIYDAKDAKIVTHLPAWLRESELASFVLLPLHENRRGFAVLLAGWNYKRTSGFTVQQIRQVRSMLKLAGTARKLANAR